MEHSGSRSARTGRHIRVAFVVGLGLRLAVGQLLTLEPSWDGVIYERAASQLAAGYGYTLRMLDPTGPWPDLPTAFYPPGWPAVLSLWKLLDAPPRLDLVLCALLGALAIPLAAAFGGALGGHAVKRRTAWLVALWPGGCLLAGSWMGEPLFTVLLLAALIPLLGPSGAHPSRLALCALLLGVAAYIRPGALALAPIVLVARTWSGERRVRRALVAGSLAALALLPVLPWMARNIDRLDGPVVTSSSGANLLVGTFASQFTRIPEALDCPAGMREVTRDRCRRDRALRRIGADPLAWLALGVGKLAHTFGYEATPALQLGAGLGWRYPAARWEVWLLATPCTLYFWALVWLATRSRSGARGRIAWAAIGGIALLHFLFLGGDRYHLPLVPVIAALAAAGSRFSSLAASPRDRLARPLAPSA